jgi:hypothetical protein
MARAEPIVNSPAPITPSPQPMPGGVPSRKDASPAPISPAAAM